MAPRLVVTSGPMRGRVQALLDGRISVGRDEANILHLAESSVSRTHCAIKQGAGGEFEVVDLESHNGTFVNGIPITRKILRHGDLLRIGGTDLLFLLDDAELTISPSPLNDTPFPATLKTIPVYVGKLGEPFAVDVGGMARDLAALFRFGNVINSIREIDLLQRELLRLIFEVVPAHRGAIVLLDAPDDEPTSICVWTRQASSLSAGSGIREARTPGSGPKEPHAETHEEPMDIRRDLVQRAVWDQTAIVTTPGADDPLNVLCLPLIGIERIIGVIYLASTRPDAPLTADHVDFLNPVSRIAAVTLENILALDSLRSENRRLKEELKPSGKLVGQSGEMARLEDFIARVAPGDTTVLIRGESGTGKELVARAIHQSSVRASGPFIAINCAAIPEALLESELFGHEKGAFTGAAATRKGKLEAAEEGTVFLDEIGEMVPALQAKLLRVLQQREFERLGGTRSLPFKARVLAATNKNLEQAIKSGEFRQDLYYRLNVVSVTVPPLRQHRDDIPLLALYFAAKYAEKNKRPFKGISSEARKLLMNYSWPGNVRELENAIEHAIVLGLTEEILREDLPGTILEEQAADPSGSRYYDQLNHTRKELILTALSESKGSYPAAASLLGIHPKYLHRLARNLKLKPPSPL